MKRFYIKKSPSDLIQEQNRLIEMFLAKQDETPKIYQYIEDGVPYETPIKEIYTPDDPIDEEEAYIPNLPTSSEVSLTSIDTKLDDNIDEEDIKKLKQRRL